MKSKNYHLSAWHKKAHRGAQDDMLSSLFLLSSSPREDAKKLRKLYKTISKRSDNTFSYPQNRPDIRVKKLISEIGKKAVKHIDSAELPAMEDRIASSVKHFFNLVPAGTSGREIGDCFEEILIKNQDQISSGTIEELILILSNSEK